MDLTLLKDLGLLGLVGIILSWMFREQSKLNAQIDSERKLWMTQAANERMKWQEIINGFNVCQAQLMTEHRDFREQVNEAHRYQREEHQELLENMRENTSQMKEVTAALGRINGYKDEHH